MLQDHQPLSCHLKSPVIYRLEIVLLADAALE